MRIAVANWSCRKVGGTEDYLDEVIPELARFRHEVGFFCEVDAPANRRRIKLPEDCSLWSCSEAGSEAALATLRGWNPDLIYCHKLSDPALEEDILKIAPSIFFIHDYHGMCISGLKTFKFPVVRPCARRFGWQCLMHYFPHRCGGKNPITMWKLFNVQSHRLQLLHRYQAIVTHSSYMQTELLKQGFSPKVVHKSSYLIESSRNGTGAAPTVIRKDTAKADQAGPCRLLFIGRMDSLKGGRILIDALPFVASGLSREVHLTFAGDGSERARWERRANQIQRSYPGVRIEFAGWLDEVGMEKVHVRSHLLVVPSLWPEPFGRVGPQAGLASLPVAAFAVGGISEWLVNGINGFLAPADPPTPEGLARAVIRCLEDPVLYTVLRRGALDMAKRFSLSAHMHQLLHLFESAASFPRKLPI
jgi:glycosyltransferase involved in cell wall biosynthesis